MANGNFLNCASIYVVIKFSELLNFGVDVLSV